MGKDKTAQQIVDDANMWGHIIDKEFILTDGVSDDVSQCQKVYFTHEPLTGADETDTTQDIVLDTSLLGERESSRRFRSEVTSHEFGHALGLSHSVHGGDLMKQGGNVGGFIETNDMNRIYAAYARTGMHDPHK